MVYPFIGASGTGELRSYEEGLYLRLRAEYSGAGDAPEAYLVGSGGELKLGRMLPEGGGFSITRLLPKKGVLEQAGCIKGLAVKAAAHSPWRSADCPLCAHGECRALKPCAAYEREEGESRFVAVPFEHGRELCLSGLFCLLRIERVRGKSCAVVKLDGFGKPLLP